MENWKALRPNSQDVAAKIVDDEAILINVANGAYYSMDKVGAMIWSMIEVQASLDAIVDAVVAKYDVSSELAHEDVQRLAKDLYEENLVAEGQVDESETPIDSETNDQKIAYQAPSLNIYRDMANLLALDPPSPVLAQTDWQQSSDSDAA